MRGNLVLIVAAAAITVLPARAQSTANAFVAKISGTSMTSSVSLALGSAMGSPGQTIQLAISLTAAGTAAPAAFQMDLSFDAAKLAFVSASAGMELNSAGKAISSTVLPNGNVRLLTTGMSQTTISNGPAANVSFTLQNSFVMGSLAVNTVNCITSTALGGALSTGCSAGTIKAFGCDLNGDASIDVVDLQVMINEAVGAIPPVHDLNQDGVVNVVDVQKEISAALGFGCM